MFKENQLAKLEDAYLVISKHIPSLKQLATVMEEIIKTKGIESYSNKELL